jgi:hypothetical protein
MTQCSSSPSAWLATLALGLLAALPLPACLGSSGPQLPPNVGATHPRAPRSAGSEQEEVVNAEPMEIGSAAWANYHDTGFFFRGVIVERRADEHRIVYADGANEWLPAAALRPDTLTEEANIHVRPNYEGEFAEAVLGRRLGDALYVRHASGGEGWTSLPHVRFHGRDEGVPMPGPTPSAPAPSAPAPIAPGEVGSSVLVDYHGRGLRFGATVTARGDDGRLHVVYLDGESEWVAANRVGADELGEGDVVHIRRTWEPPVWVRGRIRQRIGSALRVELDDGGMMWTSMLRVRVPAPGSAAPVAAPEE